MKIVRASEIGTYVYCRRAWWYDRQGLVRENQAELAGGSRIHEQHGQRVAVSGCLRSLALVLLLAGMVMLTVILVQALV